jgi:hypothetical protein
MEMSYELIIPLPISEHPAPPFVPFEYFVVTPTRANALNHLLFIRDIRVIRGQASRPNPYSACPSCPRCPSW